MCREHVEESTPSMKALRSRGETQLIQSRRERRIDV
jgi:hypothetical protein